MRTAAILHSEEKAFVEEMRRYVEALKTQRDNQSEAYLDAKDALIRTGVITKKGNTKKKIVSWE